MWTYFPRFIALGKAEKINFLEIFLKTLCFGNLIATDSKPAVVSLLRFEYFFFFKIKVIGPGQKLLYNLKNSFGKKTSFEASLKDE